MTEKYNGYSNYETWNVCLWISNDEGLYYIAKRSRSYKNFIDTMANAFSDQTDISHQTSDGVSWHDSSINLNEMETFFEDL